MSLNDLSPEERLLRAMITLNAINNDRPPPDFDKIEGGWITRIDSKASVDETLNQIRKKMRSAGWSINSEPEG